MRVFRGIDHLVTRIQELTGFPRAHPRIYDNVGLGIMAMRATLPPVPNLHPLTVRLDQIVDLVEQRRDEMIAGTWDPFTAHAFISNGTGLELEGTSIPAAGTEVKPAGEEPTAEWLLSLFNFDLQGVTILE